MGLRFRQRIKVFPGVHLNVSLGGMSVSMGGPGATVNVGKGMRVRGTVGLPGTGLSYQSTLHPGAASGVRSPRNPSMPNEAQEHPEWTDAAIEEWIQSNVRGLSVHAPSIRQMVVFEEARLLDSSKKSN